MILAIGMIAVVIAYAVLSVVWTSRDPGWYASLPRPRWQPPDIVFGIIWPLNFLALGIASWVIGTSEATAPGSTSAGLTFGGLLCVSVGFSLGWAYLFYVPHHFLAAAVSLTVASALTWALVAVGASAVWWVGVLLLPYAVWLSIAATLAYGYAYLVNAAGAERNR